MASFRIRDSGDLSRFFTTLLSREVQILQECKLALGAQDPFMLAVYAINKKTLIGACAMDFSLAASMAAGLSMFPAAVARSAAHTGHFDSNLRDNLNEVFNVSSRFFGGQQSGQVELYKVYQNPRGVPSKVLSYLSDAKFRIDARLSVEGYSEGELALIG